jgi:mono/diheme cytochrome c family protein
MSLLIRAAALLLCASLWASTQTVTAVEADLQVRPAPTDVEADLQVRPALSGVEADLQVRPALSGVEADLQVRPNEGAGKEILTRKCFQCHQASMWSSLRQDRKAWEGVLYRMVGRGALWTEAEINAMADFLAQTRGPK